MFDHTLAKLALVAPARPSAPDGPARASSRPDTLAEFWTLVHEPHLRHGRRGTYEQHAYRWTEWIAPHLGRRTWAELDAQAVADWLAMLRQAPRRGARADGSTPLAPATIRNFFATLSAILAHAVALGYLGANPCGPVRRYLPDAAPAGETTARERAYSADQVRALLSSRAIPLDRRLEFAFAVYTCCRRGEVHGVRWGELHAATSTEPAHVRIAHSHDGPTKSGKARTIPLHSELLAVLEVVRARWGERFGREPAPLDLVFPTRSGAIRGKNTGGEFRRFVDSAGLPPLTYHGLRHTGATLYRAASVSRDDCAALLGHALAQVTDLYAPPQLPLLAQAIERLRLRPELGVTPPPAPSGGGGPLTNRSGKQAIPGQRKKELVRNPPSAASVSSMPHPDTMGAPRVDDFSNREDSGPLMHTSPADATAPAHTIPVQGYAPDELAALLGAPDTEPSPAPVADDGAQLAALMGWAEGAQ